jgi:hypothetical protein
MGMRFIWAFAGMLTTAAWLVPCSTITIGPQGKSSALFPFERGGKVGFINSRGRVVIAPKLPGPLAIWGPFSDGLARVGNEGYLNQAGEWAIRGRYSRLGDFSEGVAEAELDDSGETVLIDRRGKIVSRDVSAGEFREGLRPMVAEATGSQDFDAKVWITPLEGFENRLGKVVVEPKFVKVAPFSEGLARAIPDCSASRQLRLFYPGASCAGAWPGGGSCGVGFLNHNGVFAIAPKFEDALDFSEGLAAVQQGRNWGFIDRSGKMVIPATFDQVRPFQEGLAAIGVGSEEGTRWGFIDKTGRIVISANFAYATEFSDSMAQVGLPDDKTAYIDRQGRVRFFSHGLIHVFREPDQIVYLNHDGREVFRFTQSRY